MDQRELDLSGLQCMEGVTVRLEDLHSVRLELGVEALALVDPTEMVHHARDEWVGRAGDGRIVHADLSLPLTAQQLVPGLRRILDDCGVVDQGAGHRHARRDVALVLGDRRLAERIELHVGLPVAKELSLLVE